MICCGVVESYIASGTPGGGSGNQSCFVFPGLNLSHYYAYVHGNVILATFEEGEGSPLGVYMGFRSNFNLSGDSLHGTKFGSFWAFDKNYFEWYTSNTPPSNAKLTGFMWEHGGAGSFDWNWSDAVVDTDHDFPPYTWVPGGASKPTPGADVNPASYNLFRIGDINMFNWDEETGDGYLFMLGGAYYDVTDPGVAQAVRINFQGSAPLHDYFPWAIKISSGWRACNSQEHGHQSMHNSAWRDDKNRDGDTAGSTVFYYQNGSWKVAPRLE